MPFVYETSTQRAPWLKLQVGNGLTLVDTRSGAYMSDGSGKIAAKYNGGSFFAGLGRPWMGLHTIDTVRRDAARQHVWFETKRLPSGNEVEVVLTHGQTKLVYTIDMKTDVIEKIALFAENGCKGELMLSYLQDIDHVGGEFAQPEAIGSGGTRQDSSGMLWLVKLVDGRW